MDLLAIEAQALSAIEMQNGFSPTSSSSPKVQEKCENLELVDNNGQKRCE